MPTHNEPQVPDASACEPSTEVPENESSTELDFEAMDLSVESVEERISPSETNVFDK